jgi:hypothetical protein
MTATQASSADRCGHESSTRFACQPASALIAALPWLQAHLFLNRRGHDMGTFPRKLQTWTALIVVLTMGVLDFGPAVAGLAPSRISGSTVITSARDADMLVAQRAFENKIVAQKLRDYGVTAADAQFKLASMSDQDLHTLATASTGLPSGGDGAVGAIIGVLVVVILVIVVLKLMHHDVVVK